MKYVPKAHHEWSIVAAMLVSSCKIDQLEDPIIVPLVDQEFNLDLCGNS